MANDDDYDFSGVSQPGPFDIESAVLSQWRAQNDDEEDDDYSYFWPDQLPYDIEEKLREINKVHQEDETPIESDRPRKITFNSRVQMRAISMRRIPPPAENTSDEPFDLSKYDTDESVDDVETSITTPRESAKAAVTVPQSPARPLPVPTPSSSRGPAAAAAAGPAAQQRQRFANKTAVSRVGQGPPKSAGGLATSGFTAKGGSGSAGPARRGFSESQNFQLSDGLASDRLSVLSLTDDDDDCVVGVVSSDTGYSSGGTPAGDAPPQRPESAAGRQQAPPAAMSCVKTATSVALPSVTAGGAATKSVSASAPQPVSPPAATPTTCTAASVSAPVSRSASLAVTRPAAAVTTASKSATTSVSSYKVAASVSPPSTASVATTTSRSAPCLVSPSQPSVATMTASVSNRVPHTELNPGPAPVRVSPAPVRESPPPVHTSPAPVRVSPAPVRVSPAPVRVSPPPVHTSPAPVRVSPAPVRVSPPPVHTSPATVRVSPAPVRVSPAPVRVSPAPVRVTLPPSRSATQSREPSAEQPSRPAEEPADDDLPETIRKIWSQVATPTEAYRPSWNEPAKKSLANGKTPTMHTSSSQTSNLNESPSRKSSDAPKVNGCEDDESKKTTKACVCKTRTDKLCHCNGDPSAPSCETCGGVRTALSNGGRSEDSAVDSMTEPTSSSTDGSVGGAAEPARPAPEQSYAAIHLPAQVDRRAAEPPQPPQPPPLRRHDFTITRSPQSAVGRSRLSRSSSAGRPASSAGCPPRPRTSASADRPATSGAHQRPAGGSPDRAAAARPRSAPVRGTVSAPTLPRRQPAAQRTGRQTTVPPAGTSPPPRRRRARSQDPTLTFQEWLQQHERERAKAIQDRKNNARKRKQEANIKQEKAPQAFRVWLRKKRQQQLMEQRVQQLRQHEMLAAAAAAPPGRHQQDAFRQWLARKQRERLAAGLGPSQATLRSLSALYRVGRPRPPSGARPPTAPAAAGDRATPHTHLQHIYGPNVGRGHRCRPACLPGT